MTEHTPKDPELDEEYREQLRNDLNVIVHVRTTTESLIPRIRLTAPVDINWLIGRREDHEVEPYLRGIDE